MSLFVAGFADATKVGRESSLQIHKVLPLPQVERGNLLLLVDLRTAQQSSNADVQVFDEFRKLGRLAGAQACWQLGWL